MLPYKQMPPIVLVTWHDAASEDAIEADTPVETALVELTEVGFLLSENSDAVTIGMEIDGTGGVSAAARWRLHIPKVLIKRREVLRKPREARLKKALLEVKADEV